MGPIRPLPKEVAEQINSSTSISSLHQVVCGLLENALEAQADVIDVSVDFQLGSCTIEDNGVGIPPNEFEVDGGLCKPYRSYDRLVVLASDSLLGIDTSKFIEGFAPGLRSGTFLASLASLSTLTVTSHHHAHISHATLIVHHSKAAARLVPAPAHHSLTHRDHGTKVTVRDLFGALPVRVKHRTLSRELPSVRQKDWHVLRHAVTGVLLAWNASVSLTIKTSDDAQRAHFGKGLQNRGRSIKNCKVPGNNAFDLDYMRGLLAQGGQCEADSWESWSKLSARTSDMTIRAIVSNEPAPSKYCQFISLGRYWMDNDSGFNVIYDEVNKVFTSSSFGVDEELISEGIGQLGVRKKVRYENGDYTNKELKGRGKGIDRWPMFYIRIEPRRYTHVSYLRSDDGRPEGGKALQLIIEILDSMMTRFLSEHHYRVHARQIRTKKPTLQHLEPGSKVESGMKADLEELNIEKGALLPTGDLIMQATDQQEESISSDVGEKSLRVNDDLGSTVVFPKLSRKRDLGFQDSVGGWSRIKAARPIDTPTSKSLLEPVNTLAAKPNFEKEVSTRESSSEDRFHSEISTSRTVALLESKPPGAESTYQTIGQSSIPEAPENLGHADTDLCLEAELSKDICKKGDEPLPWINPLTKSQVMINSRTGLLMTDLPQPATPIMTMQTPLSKSRRPLTKKCKLLRASTEPSGSPAAGTWAHEFLGLWDNPVFNRNEENIKQVSLTTFGEENGQILSRRHSRCTYHGIEKAFTELSTAFTARISTRSLGDATILGQLDKKFILVKAATTSPIKNANDAESTPESHALVLIDQHAADERYGVEALLQGLCSPPSSQTEGLQTSGGLNSAIETVMLVKPIPISLTAREQELLRLYAMHFANWGILLDFVSPHKRTSNSPRAPIASKIHVLSLPPLIAERCRSDVKHLTDLLRDEVWRLEELGAQAIIVAPKKASQEDGEPEHWLHRIRTCPPGILNMLNSRSCRSAIMFNDELTLEECETLVRRLAQCQFPFQCAHGRPTMIPLVDLGAADDELQEGVGVSVGRSLFASDRPEECEVEFVDAWKRWRAREREADAEEG